MFSSRCFKVLRLFLLLMVVGSLAIGCSWYKNGKSRDNWWQIWRPKAKPRIAVVPDDEILPPLDDPALLGSDESIPWAIESADSIPGSFTDDPTAAGVPHNEPIRERPEGILLDLDTVHFAYDSTVLGQSSKQVLDQHAQWLGQNPDIIIQIEGHCDERGTFEYNMNLGQRRADKVREYLISKGVDDTRIYTISYGEERPLDAGSSESAHAKNRRAQFLAYGE